VPVEPPARIEGTRESRTRSRHNGLSGLVAAARVALVLRVSYAWASLVVNSDPV